MNAAAEEALARGREALMKVHGEQLATALLKVAEDAITPSLSAEQAGVLREVAGTLARLGGGSVDMVLEQLSVLVLKAMRSGGADFDTALRRAVDGVWSDLRG